MSANQAPKQMQRKYPIGQRVVWNFGTTECTGTVIGYAHADCHVFCAPTYKEWELRVRIDNPFPDTIGETQCRTSWVSPIPA